LAKQLKNLSRKTKRIIRLAIVVGLFIGCASHDAADMRATKTNRIVNIVITKNSESLILKIKGNTSLSYTTDKLVVPMGVLFQFPDTVLDLDRQIYLPPDNEIISSIKANEIVEDQTTISRIFIAFKKDAPYALTPDEPGLKVALASTATVSNATMPQSKMVEKTPEPQKKPEPQITQKALPSANYLTTVTATPHENKVAVEVQADGVIKDYNSFILYGPPRIVFDLYNLKSPYKKEQIVAVASPRVKRIRHFGYPDKVRLVIETHQNYLSKYSALPSDTGLVIQVGNNSAAAPNTVTPAKSDDSSGNKQIKLSWDMVPDATSYNVYWSTSPGVTRRTGNKISNAQIPVTIKNLKSGVTYYFVVTSVKGSKESPESEEFTYTVSE
jgi:hypothetical protein